MTYVYVIGPKKGSQKIGISIIPDRRLQNLQSCSPQELHIHYLLERDDTHAVERRAHRILKAQRQHGEWFNASVARAISAVKRAVEELAQEAAEAAKRAEADRAERIEIEAQMAACRKRQTESEARWAAMMDGFTRDLEEWQARDPEGYAMELAKMERAGQ